MGKANDCIWKLEKYKFLLAYTEILCFFFCVPDRKGVEDKK